MRFALTLIAAFVIVAVGLFASGRVGALDLANALSSGGGIAVERDIAYGDLPRQRYDLYTPAGLAADAPLVIFFYGGGWTDGSKNEYEFAANTLAKHGYLVALPDYRLYPEVTFPDFAFDAGKAVASIAHEHSEGRPVFLMGHSAGAHIAALVMTDPRFLDAAGAKICDFASGFVGLAGPYDFDLKREPYISVFPPPLRPQEQPVQHANGAFPPALLFHGTADTVVKPPEAEIFAAALRASGNRAEARYLEGVDHYTILASLVVPFRWSIPIVEETAAFIEGERAKGYPGCKRV